MSRLSKALSHPVWIGIGSLAAVATVVLTIAISYWPGGSTPSGNGSVASITVPGSSTNELSSETVDANVEDGVAAEAEVPTDAERDPANRRDRLGSLARLGEPAAFFGERLSVSVGRLKFGPGFPYLASVTMRVGDATCEFRNVVPGFVGSLTADGSLYAVRGSSLRQNSARFVAYRWQESSNETRCKPGAAVAEQAPSDARYRRGVLVPWRSATTFFNATFEVAITTPARGGVAGVSLQVVTREEFSPTGPPCHWSAIAAGGVAGIASRGRVYWMEIGNILSGAARISGFRLSPAASALLLSGSRCLQ